MNVDEIEPNDSPGAAQDIGGGNAVVQGEAGISDPGAPLGREGDDVEDWYSFTLTSEAAIQIDLGGFLSNVDLDLGLCVVDGTCNFGSGLATAENSEGVPERIALTLGPGTYAIGVSAIDPTTAEDTTSYTLTITGGRNEPTDLSIGVTGAALPVVSGARTNLTLAVTNAGPNPTTATLTGTAPSGTILREVRLAEGSAQVSPDGTFTATLGSIPVGESATIALGLEVTAPAGATLMGSASVEAGATDTNPVDNTETLIVSVAQGTIIDLTFEPPTGNQLDPPRNLTATIREGALGNADLQRTPGAQATAYNVYRSNRPNVSPTPSNLFSTLPPTQTTVSVGAETGGSFFVVTASYPQGESAPSNEAGVEVMGATLDTVKVSKKKITITGSGFTTTVQVFLDGIAFASSARIKKNGTKMLQKGGLLTGETLKQYLTSGRTVTISVQNTIGGLSQISYVVP